MTRTRTPEVLLRQLAELRRTAQIAAALVADIELPNPAGVVEFGPQVMAVRDRLDLRPVAAGWLPAYARSTHYWYLQPPDGMGDAEAGGAKMPPSPSTVIDASGLLWRLDTPPHRRHRTLSLWSLDATHEEAGQVARRFVSLLNAAVDTLVAAESGRIRDVQGQLGSDTQEHTA